MALTHDDIKKIANLSRIHVEPSEYDTVLAQLSGVFGWIDQLQQVNTEGVLPYRDLLDVSTHERDDIVVEHDQADLILKNAPLSAHNMFAVPKVVE
ncbi:MAG: Asp-tRNA(Asn)/Glu-tRNA(Gln) amidotransferase subunit GatC [Alphaproteobacteria bacterium]|nr:Asp-tRNA(Asn)/Glu-tRNA(Gln) amidotransferase subunit GatC [Alphaproteobacteria bacterium]